MRVEWNYELLFLKLIHHKWVQGIKGRYPFTCSVRTPILSFLVEILWFSEIVSNFYQSWTIFRLFLSNFSSGDIFTRHLFANPPSPKILGWPQPPHEFCAHVWYTPHSELNRSFYVVYKPFVCMQWNVKCTYFIHSACARIGICYTTHMVCAFIMMNVCQFVSNSNNSED